MRINKIYFFVIILAFISFTPAIRAYSQSVQPVPPPALPSSPPPLIDYSQTKLSDKAPDTTGKIATSYKLQPGWSIISFPMASLEDARGFTYMIYRYSAGEYIPFDPVNHPESISTKYGYLVWCDNPSEIQVIGVPNTGQVRTIPLTQGWNLIGFPGTKKGPGNRISIRDGNMTKTFYEAMTPDSEGNIWISQWIYNSSSLTVPVNLLNRDQSSDPIGRGFWIYAYHPAKITADGRPSASSTPVISSVNPPSVDPGGRITITGTGFGTLRGYVTINGSRVPDSQIGSWSDTSITIQMPQYMGSGVVAVCAGSSLSNTVPVTVKTAVTAPLTGTLGGKVEDNDRQPINGARVMLDNGMFGYSDARGAYIIKNIPEGTQGITVSKPGYRTATGKVSITTGKVNKTLIALSTLTDPYVAPGNSTPPPVSDTTYKTRAKEDKPKLGNLTVVVDAYDDGYHRWWPRKVQVVESGNANYSWYKDWDSDLGDSSYEIYCDGVRVGKTYTIKVFWASKNGGTPTYSSWDRKIYSTDQTETIDSLH
ncbi:MAG: carboxypeptidase regulatory-like domain-containing protein [Firmicutes bacterium]|nr:carboxypeptidase regulatory-like domain-containing protein [Bacillota bacterium]